MLKRVLALGFVFAFVFACDEKKIAEKAPFPDYVRPAHMLDAKDCVSSKEDSFHNFECRLVGKGYRGCSHAQKFAENNGLLLKYMKELTCCFVREAVSNMEEDKFSYQISALAHHNIEADTCMDSSFLSSEMGRKVGEQYFDKSYVMKVQEIFSLKDRTIETALMERARRLRESRGFQFTSTRLEALDIYKNGTWPHAKKQAKDLAGDLFSRATLITPGCLTEEILEIYHATKGLLSEEQTSEIASSWLYNIERKTFQHTSFEEARQALSFSIQKGWSLEDQRPLALIYLTKSLSDVVGADRDNLTDTNLMRHVKIFKFDIDVIMVALGTQRKKDRAIPLTPIYMKMFHSVYSAK